MMHIFDFIKEVLTFVIACLLAISNVNNISPESTYSPRGDTADKESLLYEPYTIDYTVPLETVLKKAQEALDEKKAAAEKARLEKEAQNREAEQKAAQEKTGQSKPSNRESTQSTTHTSLSQFVSLNGEQYPFKSLPLNTQTAQDFIDSNPDSYGFWKNITYATTFDVLFAHYYAAGELVYDAQIGDTITMKYKSGETHTYRVVEKTIQPIDAYYDYDSELWHVIGTDFDLMIKTCYDVSVTDIIITLVEI